MEHVDVVPPLPELFGVEDPPRGDPCWNSVFREVELWRGEVEAQE